MKKLIFVLIIAQFGIAQAGFDGSNAPGGQSVGGAPMADGGRPATAGPKGGDSVKGTGGGQKGSGVPAGSKGAAGGQAGGKSYYTGGGRGDCVGKGK